MTTRRAITDAEATRLASKPLEVEEYLRIVSESPLNIPKQHVGYVYFIRAKSGHVKIGRAVDPKDRLNSLKSGRWADDLEIMMDPIFCDMRTEKLLHDFYKPLHIIREWFAPSKAYNLFLGEVDNLLDHLNYPDRPLTSHDIAFALTTMSRRYVCQIPPKGSVGNLWESC